MYLGHRGNILGDAYTHFGSGMIKAATGKVYWTQQFVKAADPKEPCYLPPPPKSTIQADQLIEPVAVDKSDSPIKQSTQAAVKYGKKIGQKALNLLKKISRKK